MQCGTSGKQHESLTSRRSPGVSFAGPRHSPTTTVLSEQASPTGSIKGLETDKTSPPMLESDLTSSSMMVRDVISPLASTVEEDMADFKELASYFLRFWKAPHAASALEYLGNLEIKRTVRELQEIHGSWNPPVDVTEALRKHPKHAKSILSDSKEARNLKFILKILGCSLHENKPYRQFLKAKTLRQKRYWLYKYQGQKHSSSSSYSEPICPTRLKRLNQFFPNNFTEENGCMYFNNKMLTYDKTRNVYYIGKELEKE